MQRRWQRSASRAPLVYAVRRKGRSDEAVQRTWVLLFRNADRINDPRCLPGWLSTTARREALAILRGQQRAIPSEDVADHAAPDEGAPRRWALREPDGVVELSHDQRRPGQRAPDLGV